jgi:hypothetical protein
MLVVGGFEADVGYGYNTKDAFPQGLGIFDLTNMQWKDQYDADAEPYITPKIIKESISETGMYPKTWDDPLVESWIVGEKSTDIAAKESRKQNNTGLIAGSVIGGVFAAAIFLSLIVLCWRRHASKSIAAEPQSPNKTSQSTSPEENHLSPTQGKVGVDGRHRRYESETRPPDNEHRTGR